MLFENVCLESLGYTLPDEIVTSAAIEQQLRPTYERLGLPEGRLELITGVQERRFWTPGTLPSEKSILSAESALQAADFDRQHLGALIHGSVCRDHLEPATACAVHHGLGLAAHCTIFDLSNACLGLLNGAVQLATMIESGQIRAGIVVGTEGSRQLVETTIAQLNATTRLTRREIKTAIASLTIGSGSCAMLLVHRDYSRHANRLLGGVARANTKFHQLCHSGDDEAVASGMTPLMETDSESLMREGIATGATTFCEFLAELSWSRDQLDRTICHQVGTAHRKMMFAALELDTAIDFATVKWLGNIGSVALPMTLAIAAEEGHLQADDRVAMLGIGSGINCLMLGAHWQRIPVGTSSEHFHTEPRAKLPAG